MFDVSDSIWISPVHPYNKAGITMRKQPENLGNERFDRIIFGKINVLEQKRMKISRPILIGSLKSMVRSFRHLPQIYLVRSDSLQELKKDLSDFSLFYILKIYFIDIKIYFYLFEAIVAGFCYDVIKNNHIFEGLI